MNLFNHSQCFTWNFCLPFRFTYWKCSHDAIPSQEYLYCKLTNWFTFLLDAQVNYNYAQYSFPRLCRVRVIKLFTFENKKMIYGDQIGKKKRRKILLHYCSELSRMVEKQQIYTQAHLICNQMKYWKIGSTYCIRIPTWLLSIKAATASIVSSHRAINAQSYRFVCTL